MTQAEERIVSNKSIKLAKGNITFKTLDDIKKEVSAEEYAKALSLVSHLYISRMNQEITTDDLVELHSKNPLALDVYAAGLMGKGA